MGTGTTLMATSIMDTTHRIINDRMEKRLKGRRIRNSPPLPLHPLAHPQTTPIGIGIGHRGGRWLRQRVWGEGREESGVESISRTQQRVHRQKGNRLYLQYKVFYFNLSIIFVIQFP